MGDNKLRVALVFGGRSGEHEVSVVSAKSVNDALDRGRVHVRGDAPPALLVGLGGPSGEGVHPAVDVGALVTLELGERLVLGAGRGRRGAGRRHRIDRQLWLL